jgi:hypothetical protein
MYTQLLFTAGWAERGTIWDFVFFLFILHLPMLIVFVPILYLIKKKYRILTSGKRIGISFVASLILYYSLISSFLYASGWF